MNRDEAVVKADQWLAEHRPDHRIDPKCVFDTTDGWEIGFALPDEEGNVRAGGRWPKHGLEVHALGTITELSDGDAVGGERPWEPRFDPEFAELPGMRLYPGRTAVLGWVPKGGGELHLNPDRVPGPVAQGRPRPVTPMEHFLSYLELGWYDRGDFGHNAPHGEVLIPGTVSPDRGYPETLNVYTAPERLPADLGHWVRTTLHTVLSELVSNPKSPGPRPKRLHINPGLPFDTEFDLAELADDASQHMRICGCYERPFAERETSRWVDANGHRFYAVRESRDHSRLRGCLIAGAIGDALGANTENLPMEVVYERHGPQGVTDLPADARITDDTQMTLFTFEAVIRAHVRERLTGINELNMLTQHAFQRWLHTQKTPWAKARGPLSTVEEPDGWLITHKDLFRKRAPGLTCTSALQEYARTGEPATVAKPANNSKGCGGVMRVAPVALVSDDPSVVFASAEGNAALTHGHPSGYLSAGVFAVLVHQLLRGSGLLEAVDVAMSPLVRREGHEEVVACVEHAIELAALGEPGVARVEALGRGGVGESAFAIALYAALVTDDPNEALLISVNHGGDSDSTASMCGNLVGALHGIDKIRPDWVERVQFRDVIDRMITDWDTETSLAAPVAQEWFTRYPPT